MKLIYNLLPVIALSYLGCSPDAPPAPDKPAEAFNVTIDGDKIATGPTTAVLFNDYLLINTYGEFDFTYLIHLPDVLPATMGIDQYSSLTMTSPEQKLTSISGGSGSVLTLSMDMADRLATGTFTAVLVNPSDVLDISNITEANFSAIKFQIASDSSQIYGELSQQLDGQTANANLVYATDTTASTASMLANVHGMYEVLIKNIPLTPGIYTMEEGNFTAATGISMQVNVFDISIYSTVLLGASLEVVSYDADNHTLIINYSATIEEPGGEQIAITNGYSKFYTGGIH